MQQDSASGPADSSTLRSDDPPPHLLHTISYNTATPGVVGTQHAPAATHLRPAAGTPSDSDTGLGPGSGPRPGPGHTSGGLPIDISGSEPAFGPKQVEHQPRLQQQHPHPRLLAAASGHAGSSPRAIQPCSDLGHRLAATGQPGGQFGMLTLGPAMPDAMTAGSAKPIVGPRGFVPIDGTTVPGWRPHGSLLSSKWVLDPPNLEEWRQKLFDVDGLIVLSNEEFEAYFPHVDNVYSHRSTQAYKSKPFISHYWECRLKGRIPGTKKSDDPSKKKRNRVPRQLNLCDVKIKITEYHPGATIHDLDDGSYVRLDEAGTFGGAHRVLASAGEESLRPLPVAANNLPAPGQKFWTIQRVNGHASISAVPGPHQHTLAKSDEVKKNSVQRYIAKHGHGTSENDSPRKASGRAHWTVKKHDKERDLKLYAACYCPFSQRVWIALEAKGLPYQYCEEDPYGTSASQQLLEANPRGTVPAIRQGEWACADSAVILEYLEEMDDGTPLFPTDIRLRANCRLWIDHINSRIVPAFNRLLRCPHPAQQSPAAEGLQEAVKRLVLAADEQGPFFLGSSLSLVDVHFAPFALRLSRTLQTSRGWAAPTSGSRWARWLDALESNPHVRATTSGKELYTETVKLLEAALDPDGQPKN